VYEKRFWRYGDSKPPRSKFVSDRVLDQEIHPGEGALWKKGIDAKYNTRNPNILACQDIHPSIFWKGVMWAYRVVAVGYRWNIGNGRSIKFWEDI
jgi:hypothetical protein